MLVEIPTGDEFMDNIVAFWRPEGALRAGGEYRFDYRLIWTRCARAGHASPAWSRPAAGASTTGPARCATSSTSTGYPAGLAADVRATGGAEISGMSLFPLPEEGTFRATFLLTRAWRRWPSFGSCFSTRRDSRRTPSGSTAGPAPATAASRAGRGAPRPRAGGGPRPRGFPARRARGGLSPAPAPSSGSGRVAGSAAWPGRSRGPGLEAPVPGPPATGRARPRAAIRSDRRISTVWRDARGGRGAGRWSASARPEGAARATDACRRSGRGHPHA
jgi:hypothetical protein